MIANPTNDDQAKFIVKAVVYSLVICARSCRVQLDMRFHKYILAFITVISKVHDSVVFVR